MWRSFGQTNIGKWDRDELGLSVLLHLNVAVWLDVGRLKLMNAAKSGFGRHFSKQIVPREITFRLTPFTYRWHTKTRRNRSRRSCARELILNRIIVSSNWFFIMLSISNQWQTSNTNNKLYFLLFNPAKFLVECREGWNNLNWTTLRVIKIVL